MMKINEFAQLCSTTAKTLRFYDEKGLLPADYVSPENGYRYYNAESAKRFFQINTLKQAGYTLKRIKKHLNARTDAWDILLLDQDIDKYRQKIALCEKLRAQYVEDIRKLENFTSPAITCKIAADRILIANEKESILFLCDSQADAELCAELLCKGSCPETPIIFDFADLKEMFLGKRIVGSGSVPLEKCTVEEMMAASLPEAVQNATHYICSASFRPEVDSWQVVELLDALSKKFHHASCIWSAGFDLDCSCARLDIIAFR